VSCVALLALVLVGCVASAEPASRRRIRAWTKLLRSDDPLKRSSAATSLLATGDANALRTLLEVMVPGEREDVRISVITAFGVKGDDRATEQIIDALEDKSAAVRQVAATALQSSYSPKAVLLMEQAAADTKRSPQTRSKIISILGEMRAMDSIPALIGILPYKDPSVSKAANAALERITLRSFGSVGEWQAWWRRSERMTREEMLEELVSLQAERISVMSRRMEELDLRVLKDRKNPKDPALLLDALAESGSRKVKLYAIEQLNSHGGKPVIQALVKALDDPDGSVRQKVVEALGAQGDRSAVPRLIKMLADPIDPVRAAAARSLGALKAKEAVGALCSLISGPPEDVAAAAARALGEIASPDAVGPLIKIVAQPTTPPKVQEEAANSLAKIKDPRATPTLITLLKSPKQSMRWAAVDALGGLRAREAVGPLAEIVRKDENPQIRELALAALAKIGDPAALDAVVGALSDKEKRVTEQAFRSLILLAEADNALYSTALDRLVAARHYALAEEVLAKAIEYFNAKPDHARTVAELRTRMARSLMAAKEWTQARPHLTALVSTAPKDPESIKALATCLKELRDRSAYLALLGQARRNFPKDEHWWSETVRIIKEIAAEGKAKQVLTLVDAIEKEIPELGGEKFASTLRDLRTKAKQKPAPPVPPKKPEKAGTEGAP